MAAWGSNYYGYLGNNSSTNSSTPVLVDRSGVLAGKTVIAIAAGEDHNLVLCSDGSMATWGSNGDSQLGTSSAPGYNSAVPVLVDATGALAGRTVIAITCGGSHNLALCSDGAIVAWGNNGGGQLGNNKTTDSRAAVLVDRSGVLAGRQVVAIAAGSAHSMALCSDGALAAWGSNGSGAVGDNSMTNRMAPVWVSTTGALAGKTIIAIAGGDGHSLALCSNGALAAWGANYYGQLGNGTTGSSGTGYPVLVNRSGVLSGKTLSAVSGGYYHSVALCADGSVAAWGYNGIGQLGNLGSTTSSVPVVTNTSALRAGEIITALTSGCASSHNLAIVASPPAPVAVTLAANAISDTGATLNGSVNPQGNDADLTFEDGLTHYYGNSVAATPRTASGISATAASAALSGLLSGITYHYRIVAAGTGGTVLGGDLTFTTSTLAALSGLTLSGGTLSPGFSSSRTSYIATVPFATGSIRVTPVSAYATIKVNGSSVASGAASGSINLAVGENVITISIVAADGIKYRHQPAVGSV